MKATGNYSSIVRGVSQQAPADRLEGQHGEQLNMLSDAIRGLVRRNGLVIENQSLSAVSGATDDAIRDSFSYRTYSYTSNDRELDLIYRTRAKVGSTNNLDGLIVYDKTLDADAGFVAVVTEPTDTALDAYMDGGFSAVAAVGSFVLMAGTATFPTFTATNLMAEQPLSNYATAWVRGGTYARTFSLRVTKRSTNTTYDVSYTTKTAAYNGNLDLSGLVYTDPDYQAQVNNLTYAYNAAVNQWISDASADITPDNIAQKLIDALDGAGFAGWTRTGSHITSDDVSFIEVNDGGDGSLIVGLLNIAGAANEVTDLNHVGKLIQVQPKSTNAEVYYLEAFSKDGTTDPGLRPVIWRESKGVSQVPTAMFAMGVMHESKFYIASTPTILAALILSDSGDTVDVPPWLEADVGDGDSCPPPHFYYKSITAMGVFQDRLLIASGGTINLSRPGDYFNFYRSSVLTVLDDDPIEVYALGTEDDTIRQFAVYDRNLILYGDKFHYTMNGRVPQTPTTASIAVQFTVANTADATPVGTGQFVFCLKQDTQLAASRLMQTQAGLFQDTPQLQDVSRQLRDYINGTPAEMVSFSSPNILFVRTEHFLRSVGAFPRARPSGLYVYQYLDDDGGHRLIDSWSAWEWSTTLGTPIGMSAASSGDTLMVYTLAWGRDESSTATRAILAMSVSVRPDPTGLPYLDGMRKAEDADDDGLFTTGATDEVRALVYTAAGSAYSNSAPSTTDADRFAGLEHPHYTLGDAPPETVDEFRWTGVQGNYADYVSAYPTGNTGDLWTGVDMPAFVDITPPFVRDFHGKAKTWGRLTWSRLRVTLIRSAGFEGSWIDHVGTKTTEHFDGVFARIRYGVNLWIGRDAREVQVRLSAKKWLPLTINALEWAGQWFDATARQRR